jgi:hypothetical protein
VRLYSIFPRCLALEFVLSGEVRERRVGKNTVTSGEYFNEVVNMELTPSVISRVVHPTAAFVESSGCDSPIGSETEQKEHKPVPVPWSESGLNPKNRIDSLDEVLTPKWRIDGCTGMGTQFFTIPLFFTGNLVPMRIDTFIPEWEKCPPELRDVLELGTAFHVKDVRVAGLGISRHVLRTLEYWSSRNPDFEAIYLSLPFGSRILFENLAVDVRDIRVRIVPTHYLERQLLSCADLQRLWDNWGGPWPELVDIHNVQHCRQLSESISVVQVPGPQGSQTMVMKALTSYPKYLYHELKFLLTLPPHPNIISRPKHIVTKRCGFGGKIAVIGFTMIYHPPGTLRDILPFRRIHGTLSVADRLKWATQLTSALIHIRDQSRYYSDLRLDNILLSNTDDLVLVDFEQRGVWCGFASPELNYLDYVFMLATGSNSPEEVRKKYERLLDDHVPGYRAMLGSEYSNSEHGFSIPWSGLNKGELEAAEVFMLGRVLWCIFEGQSCPEVAIWQSYQLESDLQFPSYRDTPPEMRNLILGCTNRGGNKATSNEGGVVRKGNELVLKEGNRTGGPEAVQAEATRWWRKELQQAETFLKMRLGARMNGNGNYSMHRPSLDHVLEILGGFQCILHQAL